MIGKFTVCYNKAALRVIQPGYAKVDKEYDRCSGIPETRVQVETPVPPMFGKESFLDD